MSGVEPRSASVLIPGTALTPAQLGQVKDDGNLTDPTGRVAITRLPAPPHLLVVVDGRPELIRTASAPAWRKSRVWALRLQR